ncbi:MAG TPA: hypothetical protein VE646_09160 [Actinomycetota bacterium]|jgi:Fe-S cluster assembly iron-binding protein IscA|nr:hypothetical protein [Actinomycetota bacterium]
MLQVTDTAVGVFRRILEMPDVDGSAIRIQVGELPTGEPGIMFRPVEGPETGDLESESSGMDVFVSDELAQPLDGSVLDARETPEGATLYLRPQGDDRAEPPPA